MSRPAGPMPEAAQDRDPVRVRAMFSRVAPRYDLLNHLLSFNQDRRWRARTAQRLASLLDLRQARVLDLCCGTGDLLPALQARCERPALGCDFARPMLRRARRKCPGALLVEADALRLPLADGSLDVLSIAFGLRNLSDHGAGLREMHRVLKPGGVVAVLEFSRPRGRLWAALYGFYSRRLLPLAGGLISGVPGAYHYLPASVQRFPHPEELAAQMCAAGFREVCFELMTGGVVALHVGRA